MIFAELTPETFTTPGSALGVVAFFIAKHFLYDNKKNKNDDRVEEEKTQLLRDLNDKVQTQINVSNARREIAEKLIDERHEQNSRRLDAIEEAIPMACRYRRNG